MSRVLALGLLVTLLLGCTDRVGQDDELDARRDYRERLDVALEAYADRLASVEDEARDVLARDPALLPGLFGGVHDATATTVEALEVLRPPPSLGDAHDDLVVVMATQVETLRRVVTAAESGDDARLQEHLQAYADGLLDWHRAHDLLAERLARDD